MARKFSELTQDFSSERRERIETKKAALREDMELAELRQALSLTQSTLAGALGVQQAEISLRRFIQAMGGELEIRAVFPDRSVTIRNFSSLARQESQS
jgi:hypothetical protein